MFSFRRGQNSYAGVLERNNAPDTSHLGIPSNKSMRPACMKFHYPEANIRKPLMGISGARLVLVRIDLLSDFPGSLDPGFCRFHTQLAEVWRTGAVDAFPARSLGRWFHRGFLWVWKSVQFGRFGGWWAELGTIGPTSAKALVLPNLHEPPHGPTLTPTDEYPAGSST